RKVCHCQSARRRADLALARVSMCRDGTHFCEADAIGATAACYNCATHTTNSANVGGLMRMRVILASSLAFLLTTVVAAQDKDARRALETNLKDVYKVTKTQFFEKNNITSAGTIFVLQKDGIGVDMSEDAVLHTNKVVEGEVKT